jgi:hypothetical protein
LATALNTRSRVSAFTPGSWLITRETVLIDTPAASATWVIVGVTPAGRPVVMGPRLAPSP